MDVERLRLHADLGQTWDVLGSDSGQTWDRLWTDSGHTWDKLGTDLNQGTNLGGVRFVEALGLWG